MKEPLCVCRSGTRCARWVRSTFSVGVTGSSDKPQLPAGADWGWAHLPACNEHAGALLQLLGHPEQGGYPEPLQPHPLWPLLRSFWNTVFTFGSAFGGCRGDISTSEGLQRSGRRLAALAHGLPFLHSGSYCCRLCRRSCPPGLSRSGGRRGNSVHACARV